MSCGLDDVVGFDECSLIHLCKIKLPKSFAKVLNSDAFQFKNRENLELLVEKLSERKVKLCKFEPMNLTINIQKAVSQILDGESGPSFLSSVFEKTISDGLYNSLVYISTNFETIEKSADISSTKEFFKNNERNLKKENNIPEDDDISIMKAFKFFQAKGQKFFVSEDEHFWGYKELIESEFKFKVIEEWLCSSLL